MSDTTILIALLAVNAALAIFYGVWCIAWLAHGEEKVPRPRLPWFLQEIFK